jgi:hypothetical protein
MKPRIPISKRPGFAYKDKSKYDRKKKHKKNESTAKLKEKLGE